MCGTCLEGHLIRLLDQARKGEAQAAEGLTEIEAAMPHLLWMETEDLLSVLRRRQDSNRLVWADENVIIFLRLVEVLCLCGFFSSTYQKLIAEPLVRLAVGQECSPEKMERFRSLSLISPKCGGQYFFHAATYLTEEGFGRLRSGRDLLTLAGQEALGWFVGALMVEEGQTSDGDECITEDLRERYLLVARLVIAGIAGEPGSFRRRALLERLLLGVRRFGSRAIDEIDLWLQRRAFFHHAQRHPEWAESYHPPARPILYAYYAVKTGMDREKRRDLAGKIEASLSQKGFLSTDSSEAVTLLRGA